jgi:hypothetical protein
VVFGEGIGEVLADARGLGTVKLFGQNLASLIIKLNS